MFFGPAAVPLSQSKGERGAFKMLHLWKMHRPWKSSLFPEWEWTTALLAERLPAYRDTGITALVPDGQMIGTHNASRPLHKFYFSITLHFAGRKTWSSNKNIFKYFCPQRGSEPSSCSSRVMEQQQGWEGEGWVQERVAAGSQASFPEVSTIFLRIVHAAGLMVRTAHTPL